MAKKTGQLNVRIDPELIAPLAEIEEKHRIGQSELVRGLVQAAVAFYQAHGFFSFPVKIEPEAGWLERAMEYRASISVDSPAARQTPEAKAREAKRKAS